jgi:hypothetical protein
MLPDLATVQHHPVITETVDVLCAKTQQEDRSFFQAEVAYFIGKIAGTMRATIITKDRGEMPVNVYALGLAPSGFGKGHSIHVMENELLKGFKTRFMEDTLPVIAEQNMWVLANNRAARNGTDQQEEFDKVNKEYRSYGAYPFTFDSGTTPAVKQLRQKLLIAGAGSINMQIDEIGSNLLRETEVLTAFLELYDNGLINIKLVKNTSDNQRGEELDGSTPTNMLLFGTPSKLFDGGQTETEFYSLLETGYARRCIFGMGTKSLAGGQLSAAEKYAMRIDPANSAAVNKWYQVFEKLADPAIFGWRVEVIDDVGIELIEYHDNCLKLSHEMGEHEEIKKAEMEHRHSKALKLAGAFAFVDGSTLIELSHLHAAIKLVEESGAAFQKILSREMTYVKLAKYIAQVGMEQTHADIHEKLPFYPRAQSPRNDMMMLAMGWGYRNNVIIKKTFVDGIEFFKGETLEETDLSKMVVSYSDHWAYDYLTEEVPFDQLHVLTQAEGKHWVNHHFKQGHRAEENVIAGFNMIAIDVDEGISLQAAQELMADYRFLTYTTKRHQVPDENGEVRDRFRMLLPINYRLELDNEEYKEFMRGIFAWLPFGTDESYIKREKKSESFHGGSYHYNEGKLLDASYFIPKTSRNEERRKQSQQLDSLDNLERWFAERIGNGNRNNQMIKYALCLVDSGWELPAVRDQVHAFNKKLASPMDEQEVDSTIMITVAKKYQGEA